MKDMQAELGGKVKRMRKDRGLTLQDLSARTGITVATLSRFENNLTSLNMDRLTRIAAALDMDLGAIVASDEAGAVSGATGRNTALPVTARRSIEWGRARVMRDVPGARLMHLCSDLKNRLMFPIYIEVTSRSLEEHGDLVRHAGEEYIYVLSGAIEVHSEYYEPVVLEPNDSIYIDSSMGHALLSVGEQPARIISIVASADSRFRDAFEKVSERQGGPAIEHMRQMGIATPEDEELYAPLPSKFAKR